MSGTDNEELDGGVDPGMPVNPDPSQAFSAPIDEAPVVLKPWHADPSVSPLDAIWDHFTAELVQLRAELGGKGDAST